MSQRANARIVFSKLIPAAVVPSLLRLVGLVLRMLLIGLLGKSYSSDDIALYGLVQGVVGVSPAIAGMGFNYFYTREHATHPKDEFAPEMFRRTRLSIFMGGCYSFILAILIAVAAPHLSLLVVFSVALIALFECLSLDIYQADVAGGRVNVANWTFFIRSAGWVPFLCLVDYLELVEHGIEVVLVFWIAGLFVSLLLSALYVFRSIDFSASDNISPQKGVLIYLTEHFRRRDWLYIYASDLSLVAQLHLDRFIVVWLTTPQHAATYTLAIGFANAVQTLVSVSVVQGYVQKMLGSPFSSLAVIKAMATKIIYLSGAVGLALCGLVLLVWCGLSTFVGGRFVLSDVVPAVLIAMVGAFRAESDALSLVYSRLKLDRQLSMVSLLSLLATSAALSVGLCGFDFFGALVAWLAVWGVATVCKMRIVLVTMR